MNDKELLELAAKAIGMKLEWSSEPDLSPRSMPDWDLWNPLENDGDALRLAVKLNMSVFNNDDEKTSCACADHEKQNWFQERKPEDQCAATRRAIVRAAAEIGKDMP